LCVNNTHNVASVLIICHIACSVVSNKGKKFHFLCNLEWSTIPLVKILDHTLL
jgi:hypothetical protein